MIGLEGSGFTIAIGVILLLTGVVMYYCRQKIVQCEHKMESMFSLISTLHEELEVVKNNQQTINEQNSSRFNDETTSFSAQTHPYHDLIPVDVTHDNNLNESSESESDSESNSESEYDEEHVLTTDENVKVVDLGLVEELELPLPQDTTISNPNTDATLIESVPVTVDNSNDADDEVEEAENHIEIINLSESENGSESETESEIPVDETITDVKSIQQSGIDYSRMQVSALKKLVSERNLTTGVAKMRKHELINILQAS